MYCKLNKDFFFSIEIFLLQQVENDINVQASYLKRTAFGQYFSLVNDMFQYEKDHFENYERKSIFVANNMLRRNLLKLEITKYETRK